MSKFSNYLNTISKANDLGDGSDIQWLFHCGMLFSTRDKWWGDFKFRHSSHEGIDITYYRTQPYKTHLSMIDHFDNSIKVPAMDDGVILNICDDFLGQTIVVEQKKQLIPKKRILFVYAHIIPEVNLKIGDSINSKDIIAKVCDTYKNPQLPPHLHFSCFEISNKTPSDHLNWNLFSKSDEVNLINPVFI
ncbi:MAG: M23 family metallopeptidase [Desulfobacteraceae bacterium]|nr:M23 family metallopeptidase [Desulfobacteraceae bacterium]